MAEKKEAPKKADPKTDDPTVPKFKDKTVVLVNPKGPEAQCEGVSQGRLVLEALGRALNGPTDALLREMAAEARLGYHEVTPIYRRHLREWRSDNPHGDSRDQWALRATREELAR